MADDRGLATGILGLVAIIVIAVLFYTLANPGATMLFNMAANQTSHSGAEQAIETRETIWRYILFYPLLLGAVYIIARSVFESEGGGL